MGGWVGVGHLQPLRRATPTLGYQAIPWSQCPVSDTFLTWSPSATHTTAAIYVNRRRAQEACVTDKGVPG